MSSAVYTTPHPQTQFSTEYFASITLANASDLIHNNQLPRILPTGSVQKWLFDRTVPTAISEIILNFAEEIPCLDDMLAITQAAEETFLQEGARSICLQIGQKIVRYHLSKIRLIMGVNNQAYNLHAAASLLDHVQSASLLLPHLIEDLKLNRFSEPLAGFNVTRAPLYALGCLLNERWAMEDVLNAHTELVYFRRAAAFLGEDPFFLFLPTSFVNDCRTLTALPGAPYSPEIIQLCARIRSGKVNMLAFVAWTTSHYSAIVKMSNPFRQTCGRSSVEFRPMSSSMRFGADLKKFAKADLEEVEGLGPKELRRITLRDAVKIAALAVIRAQHNQLPLG
ncbi:hypothetical protein DFH09DRAFT_1098413 [Mycena vulgaris]|nr:hypothetical protein DFH09DRAFT_1098413 [Mycena vulgaris]